MIKKYLIFFFCGDPHGPTHTKNIHDQLDSRPEPSQKIGCCGHRQLKTSSKPWSYGLDQ